MDHIKPNWMQAILERMRLREAAAASGECCEPVEVPAGPQRSTLSEIEGFPERGTAGAQPQQASTAGAAFRGLPLSIQVYKSGSDWQEKGYSGIPALQGDRLAKRLGRYSKAISGLGELLEFLRSEALGEVGKLSTAARADRLGECGSWLEFRHFFTHPDSPVKLAAGQFCNQHLLCRLCAIRRSVRLLRFWVPRIMTATGSGTSADMVTLTIPTGENLRERFGFLTSCLRKFWEKGKACRQGRSRRNWAISSAKGAVFSVEVKRGEGTRGGGWHVHAHGVVLSEGGLDQAAIASEWCEATGGASDERAQDVSNIWQMIAVDSDDLTEVLLDQVGGELVEVFKYPMKFSELTPADRWEAFRTLTGRRLLRAMGGLKGLEPAERFLGESLQVDDLPYLKMIYRHGQSGYYQDRTVFV